MTRLTILFAAILLLAGCATAPPAPLTAANPASPEAPEGEHITRQSSLRPDEATRKSRALLSAAQKEQEKWDEYGPVSGAPADMAPNADGKINIKNMEMKHDH
jgi:hypothetical protein